MTRDERLAQGRALAKLREARTHRGRRGSDRGPERRRWLRIEAESALHDAKLCRELEREAGLEPTTSAQAVRRSSD